jgi:transcriptional regulator GlxA family with amidase domain
MARTVGILIFPDVELLDFAGPYEAFTAANYGGSGETWFDVFTVAEQPGELRARAGLRVTPDHTFDSAPPIDILVVPGGQGTRREVNNPKLVEWIAAVSGASELTTSVCTGAFLLAEAGVLAEGSQATTHWASVERMQTTYPSVAVRQGVRFVDDGAVVSSAGVSAGIDMSLYVIERLCGRDVAAGSARLMEYEYWSSAAAE